MPSSTSSSNLTDGATSPPAKPATSARNGIIALLTGLVAILLGLELVSPWILTHLTRMGPRASPPPWLGLRPPPAAGAGFSSERDHSSSGDRPGGFPVYAGGVFCASANERPRFSAGRPGSQSRQDDRQHLSARSLEQLVGRQRLHSSGRADSACANFP